MRLHELAKEIGAESKALLTLAQEIGLKVRNHSSNLAVGEIAILKAAYREEFGDTVPVVEAPAEEERAEAPAPRQRRSRPRAAGEEGEAPAEEYAVEGDAGTVEAGADYAAEPEVAEVEESAELERSGEVSAVADVEGAPEAPAVAEPHAASAPPVESERSGAPPTPAAAPHAAPPAGAPAAPPAVPHHAGGAPAGAPTPAEELRPAARRRMPGDEAGPATHAPAARPAPTGTPQRPGTGTAPAPARPEAPRHGPGPGPGGLAAGGAVAARPAGTIPPSTGKPLQTVTVRRKPPTGAKIVGRIELPPEEVNRSRGSRPAGGGPGGPIPSTGATGGPAAPFAEETDETGRVRHGGPLTARDPLEKKRGVVKGKSDVVAWTPEEEDDPLLQSIRMRNISGTQGRRPPRRVGPRRSNKKPPQLNAGGPTPVQVPISVRDLSQVLGVKANDILKVLMGRGAASHVNSGLDEEAVLEVAASLNREVTITTRKGEEQTFLEEVDAFEKRQQKAHDSGEGLRAGRPPIVAFLGHVDHGKTSLLDAIRKSEVAKHEAGGITQSMRAYSVLAPSGQRITFLDTPGHKAFTEMRARGATVTDIVVLVVAADDGVMPQTEEAIQHAKAANVPIVVALNKCDKREANPDRVLQQLAQANVLAEAWGGDVQVARVSAISGDGIDELLEKIALQAEIMDLRADASRTARGTVLEARKDDQLGAVATLLVQDGTLRVGEVVLSGGAYGRVRALVNDLGANVDEAGPSTPVNVIGFNEPPDASEPFHVLEELKQARNVAEEREAAKRRERVGGPSPAAAITLENLFANLDKTKAEELKVVLRCDVKGSLEVLRRQFTELDTKEVKVKLLRDALGGITEDDVLLAAASQAIVLGFNVVADDKALQLAAAEGVDIRTYQIIYELIDELKLAMEGRLSPLKREVVIGHVEIREVFKVSRVGNIAGCMVKDGIIRRNATVRLTRDGRIVHTGSLSSLKRFKDDVREVKEGLECGLKIDGYDDIKVGDVVEVIEVAEEKRTLDFGAAG